MPDTQIVVEKKQKHTEETKRKISIANQKLNSEQIQYIQNSDKGLSQLALEFNVSRSTIWRAKKKAESYFIINLLIFIKDDNSECKRYKV
jgi:hypothetical protein